MSGVRTAAKVSFVVLAGFLFWTVVCLWATEPEFTAHEAGRP